MYLTGRVLDAQQFIWGQKVQIFQTNIGYAIRFTTIFSGLILSDAMDTQLYIFMYTPFILWK